MVDRFVTETAASEEKQERDRVDLVRQAVLLGFAPAVEPEAAEPIGGGIVGSTLAIGGGGEEIDHQIDRIGEGEAEAARSIDRQLVGEGLAPAAEGAEVDIQGGSGDRAVLGQRSANAASDLILEEGVGTMRTAHVGILAERRGGSKRMRVGPGCVLAACAISSAPMVTGSNSVFEHEGRAFHLQAEDLGVEAKVFEVRVYEGGTVLWQKRVDYGELVEQDLPKAELDSAVRTKMDKTLLTVSAAIAKGKIGV